jgi:ABC-2 type transport system permease protein
MPPLLRAFVDVNPVSLMATAIRGLMGSGGNLSDIALALIAPVVLTLLLAPTTLWLYRKQ